MKSSRTSSAPAILSLKVSRRKVTRTSGAFLSLISFSLLSLTHAVIPDLEWSTLPPNVSAQAPVINFARCVLAKMLPELVIFAKDSSGALGVNFANNTDSLEIGFAVQQCMGQYAPLLLVYTGGNVEGLDDFTIIGDINKCAHGHELFDNMSWSTYNNNTDIMSSTIALPAPHSKLQAGLLINWQKICSLI